MRVQGVAGFALGLVLGVAIFHALEVDRGDPHCWQDQVYLRVERICAPVNALATAGPAR